jgi:GNAT superfamily N-acetyltransferase
MELRAVNGKTKAVQELLYVIQLEILPGTGYLCRAGVLESHRGRGLQKRLIRVRERKARKLGWTHVVTDTYENPASANSLIKCGFRSYLPRNPWGAKGVAYWIKRLRKETQ